MCLPGPKRYTEDELLEYAKVHIKEEYKELFDYDNFLICILKIS